MTQMRLTVEVRVQDHTGLGANHRPPTALNILIALAAYATVIGCLWLAAHSQSWPVVIVAVVVFAFINNTIFSLLHESVHRTFSRNRLVNDMFGMVSAGFFPTAFTFQRTCHLGHHCRNRTDFEMFDMYYKDDSRWLKFAQFYSILSGIYWLTLPLGCLIYMAWPGFYKLLQAKNTPMRHTGAIMMAPFINHPKRWRIRIEILYSLAFQVSLFLALDLTWGAWLACYWAFGMNWGGLQYADHAWSERDIRTGAWDLRINPVVRWIFLNYHHHRAHHMHPDVPWLYLGRYVDHTQTRPSFLKIYLRMWLGPRPADAPPPREITDDFRKLIYE